MERKWLVSTLAQIAKSFIGGDFNIFFDDSFDCLGGNPKINKQKKRLRLFCRLIWQKADVWRICHPDKKAFYMKTT